MLPVGRNRLKDRREATFRQIRFSRHADMAETSSRVDHVFIGVFDDGSYSRGDVRVKLPILARAVLSATASSETSSRILREPVRNRGT
jgi:hypothetical protein